MKPCIFALVVVSAVLLISGCSTPGNENVTSVPTATPAAAATSTPDEFAVARANYAKLCVGCHGEEGKGGLKKVEDKQLKVPNLTEGHALEHTDEKFVRQISKGGDGMPKFEDKLSPEEINAMVRFVRREFQGK